ncbi:MAG: RNA methyltransferase [Sphingobacteriia bacterium]|nr:MAG: RNA methyltransferase [Sphingobacteriia bacterium]TAG31052.1 MAG: RNA methyltransferase [Sphingobacteriia bacterium]TAH08352.1 MAG: RNA methyltransferase [Sphingobacteriia bacterium]
MRLPNSLLETLEVIEGFDKPAFESVHTSGEQVSSIRLNPFKKSAPHAALLYEAIPWCEQAFYLSERPSFTLDPLFHGGAYYVQEASSMFLQYLLRNILKEDIHQKKVLDLCAAPGGKSTLLASLFSDGLVVANELIKSRAAVLVENACKWGLPNMIVTNNDPDHFKQLEGFFDVILVDAPCSGSGLFRKDPQAINEWSLQNVQHCSERQEKILSTILPCLKAGGILVYSTCSYSAAENEQVADWLVQNRQLKSINIPIPKAWNIVATQSPEQGATGYRFYPHLLKGEGFYIAAFQKTSEVDSVRLKENILSKPSRSELEQLQSHINLTDPYQYFKQHDDIRIIPESQFISLQQLAKQLYIKKAGIALGALKGKDLIPSHEWAVSILAKEKYPQVNLSLHQSLQFLRRKEFGVNDLPTGWTLACFEGLPLGWMKVLPNRINNYYPAEWRILK